MQLHEVALLGPSDHFGEDGLATGLHVFTIVAETLCDVLWIKPSELTILGNKVCEKTHRLLGLLALSPLIREPCPMLTSIQGGQHRVQGSRISPTSGMKRESVRTCKYVLCAVCRLWCVRRAQGPSAFACRGS
jgi:hypothetical protein